MEELRNLVEQQDGVIYIEQLEEWHREVVERLEEMFKHHNASKTVKRLVLEIVRNGRRE